MDRMSEVLTGSSEVQAYLRDESGVCGQAEKIYFPEEIKELKDVMVQLFREREDKKGSGFTIQGARTGLCAGAVPRGGSIVNLSQMRKITGFTYDGQSQEGSITVQAGVTLNELKQCLKKKRIGLTELSEKDVCDWEEYQKSSSLLWFLPNPTEEEATLGGIAATNAVGSHIGQGGETRKNILGMKVVLPDGSLIEVGENELDDYCGSEGASGVIAEVTFRLVGCPKFRCGLLSFHHTYQTMEDFYQKFSRSMDTESVRIGAVDWFSKTCGLLVKREKDRMQNANLKFEFPNQAECALWTELWGETEDEIYGALETALEQLEPEDGFQELALAAIGESEMESFELLRHAVTEASGLYHDKESVMIDWRAKENTSATARVVSDLLKNADYTLMGHLSEGLTTLHILENAGQWTGQVVNILCEMECGYSMEHGCRNQFIKQNKMDGRDKNGQKVYLCD